MVWQRFKIDDGSKPLKALPKPAANSFLTAFSSRGKILGVFFIAYDGSIQLRTWTDGGGWKGWEVRGPGSAYPSTPLAAATRDTTWAMYYDLLWVQKDSGKLAMCEIAEKTSKVTEFQSPLEFSPTGQFRPKDLLQGNGLICHMTTKEGDAPSTKTTMAGLEVFFTDQYAIRRCYWNPDDELCNDLLSPILNDAHKNSPLALATTWHSGNLVTWLFYVGANGNISWYLRYRTLGRGLSGVIEGSKAAVGPQTIAAVCIDTAEEESRIVLKAHVSVITPEGSVALYIGQAIESEECSRIDWHRHPLYPGADHPSKISGQASYENISICAARRTKKLYDVYWTMPDGSVTGFQMAVESNKPDTGGIVHNPLAPENSVHKGSRIALISRDVGEMELWGISPDDCSLLAGTAECHPSMKQLVDLEKPEIVPISLQTPWAATDSLFHSLWDPYDVGKAPDMVRPSNMVSKKDCEERPVYIGTHKLPFNLNEASFDILTFLKDVAEDAKHRPGPYKDKPFPNPTYHWAVIVGGLEHELNGYINGTICYQNRMIAWQDQDHKKARTLNLDREVIWEAYLVGKTRFNDRAIQIAGEDVIRRMKARDGEVYHPLTNNCQIMANELLRDIAQPGHVEFFSTMVLYEPSKHAEWDAILKKHWKGSIF